MLDQLISLKTFRAQTNLSKATLTRLFAAGRGPARTTIGRRVLISVRAAQVWLDAHTEGAGTAPAAAA